MTAKKIDGRTKRALDMAFHRKQVSQESYRAVMRGEITLQDAKAIGRDDTPATDATPDRSGQDDAQEALREAQETPADAPQETPAGPRLTSRISKDDRSRHCTCMCGGRTRGGRFLPGHDVRMVTYAKEYVRGESELTKEQLEYVQKSGKLDRARAQVEKEERRKAERAAKSERT